MNLCGFKLFVCLFISYSLFIETTSFSPGPNHGLRQQAQFGEGVKDWFRNVRDKVHGVFFATTPRVPITPPPPPPPTFQEAFQDFTQKAMNKFFFDMATAQFNPDRDWGFRIGNWYIIRKCDGPNDYPPNQFPTMRPWTNNNPFLPPNGMNPTFPPPTFSTLSPDEIETIDQHGRPMYPKSSTAKPSMTTEEMGSGEHRGDDHTTPENAEYPGTTVVMFGTPEFHENPTTTERSESAGTTVLIDNGGETPAPTAVPVESETSAPIDSTTVVENPASDATTPALIEETPATTENSPESQTRREQENEVVTPKGDSSAEVISP